MSLDSHPLHLQNTKTQSLRASVISPVSHSWFVEGQDKNLSLLAMTCPTSPYRGCQKQGYLQILKDIGHWAGHT